MKMRQFMKSLIYGSEKAACIARACRKENDLFQLLVEEKTGDDKNTNSSHDFKTLADVLIQETVRHDIGQEYSQLKDEIFGEESNKFTNTLGESIQVEVCSTLEETSKLLSRVLGGREGAADILAKLVHFEVKPETAVEDTLSFIPESAGFDIEDLGIWIDPIDGTNNYIKGKDEIDAQKLKNDDIVAKGLPVVTVLIGVFSKQTGIPLAGVVNQPFASYNSETKQWSGKIHWGCVVNGQAFSNVTSLPSLPKPRAILSFTEPSDLVEKLKPHYQCVEAGGAGHKILCVVLGLADVYVSSKASTYKWDTCAGQALLRSIGGGCVAYFTPDQDLTYNTPNTSQSGIGQWCNDKGVIAYRHPKELEKLLQLLK